MFAEAQDTIQNYILYFNTDSVIYVSPDGTARMPVNTGGEMDLQTPEIEVYDCFVEFLSYQP